ncbi:MAG TPA: hypothetical protein VFD53_03120, partial [Ilumatobacter sp.]|nr:hypothetical protein [Ilumatobacter sp.]
PLSPFATALDALARSTPGVSVPPSVQHLLCLHLQFDVRVVGHEVGYRIVLDTGESLSHRLP